MPSKKRVLTPTIGYAFLVSILILLMDLVGLFSGFKGFRSYITYPFSVFYENITTTIQTTSISIFGSKNLKRENIELKQRLILLKDIIDIEEEEKIKQSSISKLIKKINKEEYKGYVIGEVLTTNYDDIDGLIQISVGTRDGITQGLPVVFGSSYIGEIDKAYPQYSVVRTLSVPGQEFIAYIRKRKVTGIMNTHVSNIIVSDLLATYPIYTGDTVFLRNDNMPYFFNAGKIKSIPQKTGSAEKTAIISPSIDISELHYISVITR